MESALLGKYQRLKENLQALGDVAVAYSAGVDSTLLLKAAWDALGSRAIAVTASSPLLPERELEEAKRFCGRLGVRHIVCEVDVFRIPGFRENPADRCYHCKKAIFTQFLAVAREHGIRTVAEGSNLDDEDDYRPGLVAVRELGVASPLKDAGLTKEEIRHLSKELGLPTWEKPSFACLASRFAYGEVIDGEKLRMVDGAEQLLLGMGLRQVRVRLHGDMARIEVPPEDFSLLVQQKSRDRICSRLKEMGFTYVTLDLGGYRSGSMNEALRH